MVAHRHPLPLADRFWLHVDRSDPAGCWPWLGDVTKGYGRYTWWDYDTRERRRNSAHRMAYELTIGPIPEGMTLDHGCNQPLCCNPAHLRPMTSAANSMRGGGPPARNARKTHCKHGHPFSGPNLRVLPDGSRVCRTCAIDAHRRYRERAKARASANGTSNPGLDDRSGIAHERRLG